VNENSIALTSAEDHVLMTGLTLTEVKRRGRKPSKAAKKEAVALDLYEQFKLSLVEHEEILAIAASLSPELGIGEEEEEEEELAVRQGPPAYNHQAFFDGGDYSEDEDAFMA
jgi:hypothetical protein